MSSFGITSLAILSVYYRFSWQMEGGDIPVAEMLGTFALSVGAAVGMEFWARWAHKALWHASLWHMHESHHKPREGAFELNDIFAIINAVPAIGLLNYGFFHKGIFPGLCFGAPWECTTGKEFSWNLLSLFTTSGMLFLEISLLAFLLQGSYASGLDALTRTFVISGIILSVDILLKAIYVFGFGVPLFIDLDGVTNPVKWGLWVIHKLLLTAVYGIIFSMHHTKWRERLPARPAFYNYICMMFCLSATALFACVLVASGAGFGFWLYNFTTICYHAFYLPLIYVTFLADFFQEDDLHLENVYYSEMKDAGFFDADWD